MWADIFLTKDNATPNPRSSGYNPLLVHHSRQCTRLSSTIPTSSDVDTVLTYYLPKEKIRKVKNLLANKEGEQEPELEPVQADEVISHWHHVSCCRDPGTAV